MEAASENVNINSYALIPTGVVEKTLNDSYQGGAMNTYGVDIGYGLNDNLNSSIGYYYQHRDQEIIDGSGVKGRISYQLSDDLNVGVNVSYDYAFGTRLSGNFKYSFGGNRKKNNSKIINAITKSPSNRDVRVHDGWIRDCVPYKLWRQLCWDPSR